MKKIELNLDALAVESFQVDGGKAEPRGTVNVHFYTNVGSCYRTACCPETTLC